MNKQGFAVTGILYTLLLIGIVSLNLLLFNLLNRKTLLDQIKTDTVNAVEKDSNFEYLLEQINEIKKNSITIDTIYPIGSIYITTSNTDPSTMFKDTKWVRYAEGRTLIGMGNGYNQVNEIGGNRNITLSVSNLPNHSHTVTPTGAITLSDTDHTHSIPSLEGSTKEHNFTQLLGQNGEYSITPGGNTMATVLGDIHPNRPVPATFLVKLPKIPLVTKESVTGNNSLTPTASFTGNEVITSSIGSGLPINIQNPYITVYIWKRIS